LVRRKNSGGRIRIIGGRWRGRRIDVPDIPGLRPTPDRVRETLFNWLSPYIEGTRVLDLFAGSGILGFEALSRGAASLVAVERDRGIAARLRDTAGHLGANAFDTAVTDAAGFLAGPATGSFDVIFVDPPHTDTDYEDLCGRLEASGLPAPGAFIYVEYSRHRAPDFRAPSTWECIRSGRAGDVVYQLWRRSPSASD
jgi:16S rRNA (guanine966-N2)-methyltransferase